MLLKDTRVAQGGLFLKETGVAPGDLFLKDIDVHGSWTKFLNGEAKKLLSDIEARIDGPYTPGPDAALRFFCVDLSGVKIIALGQDPYPQPGAATGRAFEVSLTGWDQKFRQSSLRNILRSIHASYRLCEPKTLNEIRDEIESGVFKLPPPDRIFDHWQEQGALFINTAFTCAVNSPGSHGALWKPFTESLIKYIAAENENIIWFLWGGAAQRYEPLLNGARTYKCNHPMLPGSGEKGFLNCACFRDTRDIVDWI